MAEIQKKNMSFDINGFDLQELQVVAEAWPFTPHDQIDSKYY